MELLIVSDIFGRTSALETLCEKLSRNVSKSFIIDPYDGVCHGFKAEDEAYNYFMEHVGLEKYTSILKSHLNPSGRGTVLIGFSVGASAIWEICRLSSLRHLTKAFCFYGSQIRHRTDICPVFDIELIFPKQEPHFDVGELIKRMQGKKHVTITKTKALHGFMNEVSNHFDQKGYSEFIAVLRASLTQLNGPNN